MELKQKRILVISQHYYPETFRITDICEGFVQDGFTVDVLCGLPNYPHGEWFSGYSYWGPRFEKKNGVSIFRCGEIRRKKNTSIRIFFNYISFPITAVFHLLRFYKYSYDAVFCYQTSPVLMLFPAIVYSFFKKTPLTCYVLDLWPENLYSVLPIQNRFLRRIAKSVSNWHYRQCDQLIAMSPSLAHTLQQIAPNANVVTIPQYCEDFYAQTPQKASFVPKSCFTILFAGNMSPAQDLNLLIACAKKLKETQNKKIHFLLVGDGMSRQELENEIQQESLQDWFTFTGSKKPEEIPLYTAKADALFAALTKSEHLGQTVPAKITSYFAAGKPCLVCVDGEASRLVQEVDCGLTANAGDFEQLYRNILALASMSSDERFQMGCRAYQYYEEHFSRAVLLKELEHLF